VAHVEGECVRRGVFGGHDQVALVLAVLVVDDDHRPAGSDVRDRRGHRVQTGRSANLVGNGKCHAFMINASRSFRERDRHP
jgi:hypothetical protein